MKSKKHADVIQPLPFADLDKAAFHGIAGEVARMLSPYSEADSASHIVQFLTLVGNLFGRGPHRMVGRTRHGTNLYVAIVGRTSNSRKGTGLDDVSSLMKELLEKEKWSLRGGLVSGEGIINDIRDDRYGWRPNKETKQMERAIIEHGVDDKRAMYVESEFNRVLEVGAREGNVLSELLRNGWDGKSLETRSKQNPQTVAEPHISLIGQITPEELLSQVCSVRSNKVEAFNGYMNRFLCVLARRTRVLPNPAPLPTEQLKRVLDRIDTSVRFAATADEIGITPEAAFYWDIVYRKIAVGLTDNLVGKLTARAEPQIVRLAMIYTLLDSKHVIDTLHLKAAVAVWEYAERSTHFIFKDAIGVGVTDTILKALRDAGTDGLTETQISGLFNRNAPAPLLNQALKLLLEGELANLHQGRNQRCPDQSLARDYQAPRRARVPIPATVRNQAVGIAAP